MQGHRHPRPDGRLFAAVAFAQQHGLAAGLFGDNSPPGIDDRRMTVSFPWPRVGTALRGGQDITLGFNRPRADQHLPMRRAGYGGERCRSTDQFGPGSAQGAVQFREAQVIAYAQAQASDRGIGNHHLAAMGIVIRLPIAATVVGDIDIEQVQLVVARYGFAMLIDQQRTGMGLGIRLPGRRQRQGASHHP
ncbi:hypothetical protein D3C72_1746030 [compost metagenome]